LRLRKWPLAAVILLVEVGAELLAVVAAADQPLLAPGVAVVLPTVPGSVAVALSFIARVFWCTTSSSLIVPSATSLTWGRKGRNIQGQ